MTRYPLEALVTASGLSEAALARRVGLSGSTLKLARERGLLEAAADRYAIRAGLVPWLVWSDWLDDLAVPCADPRCDQRFVAKRKGQRYCCVDCGHRHRSRDRLRAKYEADAEFREARIAAARAYREANSRAVSVTDRMYRAQNRERRAAQQRDYYQQNRERILARQRRYDAEVRQPRRRAAA